MGGRAMTRKGHSLSGRRLLLTPPAMYRRWSSARWLLVSVFSLESWISSAVHAHEHQAREASQVTFIDRKDGWKNVVFLLKSSRWFFFFFIWVTLSVKLKLLTLACNELHHLASIYWYLPPLWTPLLYCQPSFHYCWCLEGFAPGCGKARSFSSFRSQLKCYHFWEAFISTPTASPISSTMDWVALLLVLHTIHVDCWFLHRLLKWPADCTKPNVLLSAVRDIITLMES